MDVDDIKCQPETRILYLDRQMRRAANTYELVGALKKMHLRNTIIEVTNFDHLTIMEQLRKVNLLSYVELMDNCLIIDNFTIGHYHM